MDFSQLRRREVLRAATLAASSSLLASAHVEAHAQAYPSRPVQVVVPFPPGGVTDALARMLGTELQLALGQPFLVLNKPGASGAIAAEYVKNAPPDGYTLMMGHIGTHAVNPSLYPDLSYNPVTDFVPVALLASTPVALFASSRAPGKTWAEILAASRARPGELTFASFGPGSSSHLYAEQLQSLAGVKWLHVPYKGPAPAMQALLSGEVDLMFDTLASGVPQARSGRIRAVAVASATRSSFAGDVPTFEELKVSGMDGGPWFALFGPRGMPRALAKTLADAVRTALGGNALQGRLAAQGIAVINQGPAELAAFQKKEMAKWADSVKRFNIKVD